MRKRLLLSLILTACALLSLPFLHKHLRVLTEISHTYSAFYPLLAKHPELVYKYPDETKPGTPPPKIIHQIALGNANVAKYQPAIDSCKALHPEWTFNLWRNENATDFLAQHYPDILPHFKGYHQDIQRANVLRYALLHQFGGVYLDLDITCLVALDSTPLYNLPFITPGAHPAGVNNAFILALPGHAFLNHLLSRVPRHDIRWGLPMRLPYIENMLSTGCMFFSNMWMAYAENQVSAGRLPDNRVFVLADEHGDLAPHMLRGIVETPLMAHGGASSWHGWDAAAIVLIGKHYRLVVTMLALGITASIVYILCCCIGARLRRRRSWAKVGGILGLDASQPKEHS
ncbi:hypothetical protein K4F52_002313 [Lecanicillium sp. MT-2017a]|nr:hypothetical protein K4F52_002313 [Lecanicillium sp. MT-2017a]